MCACRCRCIRTIGGHLFQVKRNKNGIVCTIAIRTRRETRVLSRSNVGKGAQSTSTLTINWVLYSALEILCDTIACNRRHCVYTISIAWLTFDFISGDFDHWSAIWYDSDKWMGSSENGVHNRPSSSLDAMIESNSFDVWNVSPSKRDQSEKATDIRYKSPEWLFSFWNQPNVE